MEREETSTLMTTDDLIRHLRMSRVTIWRKRAAGDFPKLCALGGGQLRWKRRDIDEWIHGLWDAALGRQVPERTSNLIAATFLHDVNRNGEPQLHIHAVVANATKASDGKWHAVRNDELYRAQHVLSAVHNAELRSRVEAFVPRLLAG